MTTPTTPVFTPTSTKLTILERHEPDQFYQTRSGLWVSESFRTLVVAKAKPTEAGTVFSVTHPTMLRNASDEEIEWELGGEKRVHLFDETQVSAIIARLINGQPKGEAELLLNNGYANLFYLVSCVAHVHWHSDCRGWRVASWPRDDYSRNAGSQVFFPGN